MGSKVESWQKAFCVFWVSAVWAHLVVAWSPGRGSVDTGSKRWERRVELRRNNLLLFSLSSWRGDGCSCVCSVFTRIKLGYGNWKEMAVISSRGEKSDWVGKDDFDLDCQRHLKPIINVTSTRLWACQPMPTFLKLFYYPRDLPSTSVSDVLFTP